MKAAVLTGYDKNGRALELRDLLQIFRFTSGACQPVLAENAPPERFPGARTQ